MGRARQAEEAGLAATGLARIGQRVPAVGDVSGVGAFFGLDLVKDRNTRVSVVPWQGGDRRLMTDFQDALLARGVWLYTKYNLCVFAPLLVIEKPVLDDGLSDVGDVLAEFGGRMGTACFYLLLPAVAQALLALGDMVFYNLVLFGVFVAIVVFGCVYFASPKAARDGAPLDEMLQRHGAGQMYEAKAGVA